MNVGVNRFKASSHPTRADGLYLGVVKRVIPGNKVYVYVPKLSNTIGPMRVLNMIEGSTINENSRVICGHVGGGTEEMYVIGHLTPVTLEYLTPGAATTQINQASRDIKISIFMDVD